MINVNPLRAARDMVERLWGERQFNATVVSTAGSEISVQRTSESIVEGPYPAAEGLALAVSAGDRVKVEWVAGVYQVAYKVAS